MMRYFKKGLQKLYYFSKENPLLMVLFVLSCFYFIFQHLMIISWDFSAYVMNAKYLFYGGDYFELYRAPLTYLILAPLLLLKRFGELVYIFLVSILFLYSNIRLSELLFNKTERISKETIRFIFYFFSLSGFVLVYGFSTGSELLNLSFISLFLVFFISGKKSGHFLGLAFLTRYNSLIFLPLILFGKDIKKIIWNFLLFLAVIFPWFLYNFLFYGNWLASFMDSYTLNVHLRTYLFEKFIISMLLPLINWFFIFFIIGIVYSIILLFHKAGKKIDKYKICIFLLLGVLILYEFSQIPLKFERYLFNLSLVVAFFSSVGSIFLLKEFPKIKKILLLIFFISFIIMFFWIFSSSVRYKNENLPFRDAAKDIDSLNISTCEVLSPFWVPMNYLTSNVRPLGRNDINQSVNSNKMILIFTEEDTIDDLFDLEKIYNYPIIIEHGKYIILGNENISNENCFKITPYKQRFTYDPCKILGEKMSELKLGNLSKKICDIVN